MEQKAEMSAATPSNEAQAFEEKESTAVPCDTSAAEAAEAAAPADAATADDSAAAQEQQDAQVAPEPEPSTPAEAPNTIGTMLFKGLACLGPILPALCVLAFIWPWAWMHPLTAESTRVMELAAAFPTASSSLFVFANGAPVVDISVLSMWFMQGVAGLWNLLGLSGLTGLEAAPATLFTAGISLASVIAVIALWFAALVFTHNSRAALAACLVYMTTLGINLTLRCDLDAMLFTATSLISLTFLYAGYVRAFAPVQLILGFLFAALAFVSGGVIGLIIPLATCLFFLFWRGTFRRAGAFDGALAFGVMLVAILGWVLALFITTDGSAIMGAELAHQTAMWGTVSLAALQPQMIMILLPWILIVPFLPWGALLKAPRACWTSRNANPAAGWMWWSVLITGALVLFAWPYAPMLAPLFAALLACLFGSALVNMSSGRARLLFALIGFAMLAVALMMVLASFLPFTQAYIPAMLYASAISPAVLFMAIVCAVCGLLLVVQKRISASGGLLLTTIAAVALSLTVAYFTLV